MESTGDDGVKGSRGEDLMGAAMICTEREEYSTNDKFNLDLDPRERY